jgi:hypothetical protein
MPALAEAACIWNGVAVFINVAVILMIIESPVACPDFFR